MTAHDDRIRLLQLQLNDTAKQLAALQRLDRLGSTDVGGTLHAATAKTTPVDADTMPLIDSAASNALKKVTWANLKATLKTYFDTLYVALTGAQTIAGVKTFSNGISFGNETLANYDEGTWSPIIGGSVSDPTVAYTTQSGKYTRIGNTVFFTVWIVINTISGGSGNVRVTLPIAVATNCTATGYTQGVDLPGTPVNLAPIAINGTSYVELYTTQDNAGLSVVDRSGLANGDTIVVTGFYFV